MFFHSRWSSLILEKRTLTVGLGVGGYRDLNGA
jgi:hypothetical protein